MGNLSRKEFDLLNALISSKGKTSQRRLEELTGYSLSTVNRTMRELAAKELVDDQGITMHGLAAMEPYAAKRAVFVAAGFGSRMVPVTLNTPKPLVRVNGRRIIDGLLDACLAAGIDEIYIVRGYLAEQFDQLLYKYPMIHFLENPAYNDANNISSAVCARYLLQNAYVFEADLVISNPSIVTKYHYTSDFLGIHMERSDDWCFTVKNGMITEQKVGGLDVYQEVGISYWDEDAGRKLADDLKTACELPGGKERYWDQVPFSIFPEHYQVEVRPCQSSDIIEIDSFKELKAIDKTYDV